MGEYNLLGPGVNVGGGGRRRVNQALDSGLYRLSCCPRQPRLEAGGHAGGVTQGVGGGGARRGGGQPSALNGRRLGDGCGGGIQIVRRSSGWGWGGCEGESAQG